MSVPNNLTHARLRTWVNLDALPYRNHTGRELSLMLRKQKPLAVFYEMIGDDPELELIPDRYYKKFVDAGSIIRREVIIERCGKHLVRYVFYALPGEEWRIDAFILLIKTSSISGWNEGFSRMEGSLLGYEDWQNDAHIELTFKSRDE
ncbi:hypothetical protein HAV22_19195 [Massilia sp. TW-1]|uniref:Uncharacterized protein n=2 Tax=Telluria antibiotica TaxID=2717319 RepID=A0ABX0PH51_9BURK|nr:hypothetical protein [Telluria antibiotica]